MFRVYYTFIAWRIDSVEGSLTAMFSLLFFLLVSKAEFFRFVGYLGELALVRRSHTVALNGQATDRKRLYSCNIILSSIRKYYILSKYFSRYPLLLCFAKSWVTFIFIPLPIIYRDISMQSLVSVVLPYLPTYIHITGLVLMLRLWSINVNKPLALLYFPIMLY